jgi:hypothetical protein
MDEHALAKALYIMFSQWPRAFCCNEVVQFIDRDAKGAGAKLRALFYPNASPEGIATASSVGHLLHNCTDRPVKSGDHTLILQRHGRGRRPSYTVRQVLP